MQPHPIGREERCAQRLFGAVEVAELGEHEAEVAPGHGGVAPVLGVLEGGQGGREAVEAGDGVAAGRGAERAALVDQRDREGVGRRQRLELGERRLGRGIAAAEDQLDDARAEAADLGSARALGGDDAAVAAKPSSTQVDVAELARGEGSLVQAAEPPRRGGREEPARLEPAAPRPAPARRARGAPRPRPAGARRALRQRGAAGGPAPDAVDRRAEIVGGERLLGAAPVPAHCAEGSPPRRKCSARTTASVEPPASSQSPASRWPRLRSSSVSVA